MKSIPIFFLLLVLPAAIQCQPGGGSDGGAPVDPSALYQELTADLIGTNGLFKGMGMDNLVKNLLGGLIGPNGSLTGDLGGKGGGLIATVLKFFLAPDGILATLFGQGGILAGQNQLAEELLNGILGTKGAIAMLFGTGHSVGARLEERGILQSVQGILSKIIGPTGFVSNILNGILGPNGILRRIFNGIFGPTGFLGRIFGGGNRGGGTSGGGNTSGGMTPAPGGGTSGGMTPAPGGGTSGGMTSAPGGGTSGMMTPAPGGDTSGGTNGGAMNVDNALCMSQMSMPTQTLTQNAQMCLNAVTSTNLQGLLTTEIGGLTCSPTGMPTVGANSGTWSSTLSPEDMTELTAFINCLMPTPPPGR